MIAFLPAGSSFQTVTHIEMDLALMTSIVKTLLLPLSVRHSQEVSPYNLALDDLHIFQHDRK